MARLSKSKRDALKDAGQWNSSKERYLAKLTGVEMFVKAAAEANPIPVPFSHVKQVVEVEVTPSPTSILSTFDEIIENGGMEIAARIYPGRDELESVSHMQSAFLVNVAERIMDTHGVEEVSSHKLPEIGLPSFLSELLKPIGACIGSTHHVRYSDVPSIAKALLWCSLSSDEPDGLMRGIQRLWLPTVASGGHSDHILSVLLCDYFTRKGVNVGVHDFRGYIFSGLWPKRYSELMGHVPDEHLEVFPQLFWSYKDAPHFHKFIGSKEMLSFLKLLNLDWSEPSPTHLCFNKSLRDLTVLVEKKWSVGYNPDRVPLFSARDVGGLHPGGSLQQCFYPPDYSSPLFVGPLGLDVSIEEMVGFGAYGVRFLCSSEDLGVYRLGFNFGSVGIKDLSFEEDEICEMEVYP